MSQSNPDVPVAEPAAALTLQALAAQVAELQARVAALEAAQVQPQTPAVAAVAAVAPVAVAVVAAPQAPLPDALTELRRLTQALFSLGLNATGLEGEAADAQFDAFRALVHADRQGSPLLNIDLRRYKWSPFLGRVRDYLADPASPGSFEFERLIPDRIDPRTEQVKAHVQVRHGRRMAPPVTFRRDPSAGGAFRIEAMSL